MRAAFEGVNVATNILVRPGTTSITLRPERFPQLHLTNPRLWWPNGYGKPELYHLQLSVSDLRGESDRKQIGFGVREVSYHLSLFNHQGRLQRSELLPTMTQGVMPVDVTHEGIRATAHGWAATLTRQGETSNSIRPIRNEDGLTDLVILVNGVRIAARGGNWGMDDSRKRVSREHLEPFFRLHRDAHLNIIRNWVGQNSEEVFYQLADEYGLMVWNDFWESTQNSNVEPDDPALFLRNARDVISHFRNHPSIVIWCGRNEGVPQPAINEGLIEAVNELDGTRYYTPNSRDVNLRGSGPYNYKDPAFYYGEHNQGFSVELGVASFSTLESFQHSVPLADEWPISDTWAYHDWHQVAGGDTHPWMAKLDEELGEGKDLKDFERKAQIFNYVDHRAIFEGFNQHLWSPNSGRLLWMTQPAWPSNNWQIMNSDYDTSAAYYGVKKACEPIHIQLDLANFQVALADTTRDAAGPLQVAARIYSLQGALLWTHSESVSAAANSATQLFALDTTKLVGDDVKFVRLEARDASGSLISDNFYWLAPKDADYRQLNELGPAQVDASATPEISRGQPVIRVHLSNRGTTAALQIKLVPTRVADGERLLPAYLSDNYLSLLPGEDRSITLEVPHGVNAADISFGIRGWNVPEARIAVGASQ